MRIEIHLYGQLRRYADQSRPDRPSRRHLPAPRELSLAQALGQAGIAPEEVGQVFLNGKLLNTRFSMAPWLGYPTERERLPASGDYLETRVRGGDRLGLFPPDMAILVV